MNFSKFVLAASLFAVSGIVLAQQAAMAPESAIEPVAPQKEVKTNAPETTQAAVVRPAARSFESVTPKYTFENEDTFYNKWIKGRLTLGVSVSRLWLTDNEISTPDVSKKHNFLGNITRLEEESPTTVAPVLTYLVCDYFRVGLGYDKVCGRTYNWNNGESDGNVEMKGPSILFEGAYPFLDGMLVPHAGLGVTFYSGDFDEDTWWRFAYSDPWSWQYLGSTSKSRTGYFREIDVDDEVAAFFTIGFEYNPFENLMIDVSFKVTEVDPDCKWGYRKGNGNFSQQGTGHFDLSHYALTIGASYRF